MNCFTPHSTGRDFPSAPATEDRSLARPSDPRPPPASAVANPIQSDLVKLRHQAFVLISAGILTATLLLLVALFSSCQATAAQASPSARPTVAIGSNNRVSLRIPVWDNPRLHSVGTVLAHERGK